MRPPPPVRPFHVIPAPECLSAYLAVDVLRGEFSTLGPVSHIYLNEVLLDDDWRPVRSGDLLTVIPGAASALVGPVIDCNTDLLQNWPGICVALHQFRVPPHQALADDMQGSGSGSSASDIVDSTTLPHIGLEELVLDDVVLLNGSFAGPQTTTQTTCGPGAQGTSSTSTTTPGQPEFAPLQPPPAAVESAVTVCVVFALPGTRCRSVLWRADQPISHALWPLLTHFTQHIPWDQEPVLHAANRFVRDTDARPDLLIDGARASDAPAWHNGTLATFTPDWRSAVTEPVCGLFEISRDLHFLQFPVPIPACLHQARTTAADSRREFMLAMEANMRAFEGSNGYLAGARYVCLAIPGRGLRRLRLVHELARLRERISDKGFELAAADILDCRETIADGCLYVVQFPRHLQAAWFLDSPVGTDAVFVPFDQHPSSCIPCLTGHIHVARSQGAFGFLQHRQGPPQHEPVDGWRRSADEAWEQADGYSTDSEVRLFFESGDAGHDSAAAPADLERMAQEAEDVQIGAASSDSVSLLQVGAALRRTAVVDDETPGLASTQHLRVVALGQRQTDCHVVPNAPFREVHEVLEKAGATNVGDRLVPVFPQTAGPFCCLVVPDGSPGGFIVAVICRGFSEAMQAAWVAAADSAADIACRLDLKTSTATLNDRSWNSPEDGFFHGMCLRFSDVPRSNSPCNSADRPARTIISLVDCLPEPHPGIQFGVSAHMAFSVVSAHAPRALRGDIQQVPGLDKRARDARKALPSWNPYSPLQAFFVFTDGSYCPHTGRVSWLPRFAVQRSSSWLSWRFLI